MTDSGAPIIDYSLPAAPFVAGYTLKVCAVSCTCATAFCIHLNQEQTVEIIRIIGQIMCIIVLKPTPLMHCVHPTRQFDAQTVFEYNSQADLGAQVQYWCWQALISLVPATKNN